MKGSGNALMFGLGGLALGAMVIEGKTKALTLQLQAARAEASREREMRIGAERSRDDQRRIANENANAVAARDAEIQRLKAELARLHAARPKESTKEDKKT